MTATKYGNLYPKEFLNYFGNNEKLISDIELQSNEYSIDIDEMIKKLGIDVKEILFNKQLTQHDIDNKIMYINVSESPKKQRFEKAHKLSYFTLDHKGNSKMTTKYIETITFDEIIKQALEQKEKIAQNFIQKIEDYKQEYSFYTLIVDFRQDIQGYHLNFIVDNEPDNGYVMGFNLKLMTFCKDEYVEDEITKELIIDLLEQELSKLEQMTKQKEFPQKNYIPNDNTNKLIIKLLEEELHNRKQFIEK